MYTDTLGKIAQAGTGYRLGLLNMASGINANAIENQTNTNYALANMRVGFANQANQSAMNARSNLNNATQNLLSSIPYAGNKKTEKDTKGNDTEIKGLGGDGLFDTDYYYGKV
jgi:DNA uptake protein ComE-like DNA-binding protein